MTTIQSMGKTKVRNLNISPTIPFSASRWHHLLRSQGLFVPTEIPFDFCTNLSPGFQTYMLQFVHVHHILVHSPSPNTNPE